MNARYDLSLLDRECRRYAVESISELLGDAPAPVIDPLVIDKHVDKYRKGKRALHALCAHYGVSSTTRTTRGRTPWPPPGWCAAWASGTAPSE